MRSDSKDELAWLAFRYVADEMSADERYEFEQRLAEDQQAREEVARAVELAQAVAFAHADVRPVRLRLRRWSQPARWATAAAAALLLGVLIHSAGFLPTKRASLATMWFRSSIHQSLLDQGETGPAELDEMTTLVNADDADLTVPAWLIEAVSGSPENQRIDGSREES